MINSLSKEQKEAVGLLQIGTLLEYFDLMLYVHMAVLLNELFFPKTDPFTASLLSAFAFCSTYILRPFGALFFGYIGDYFGRKITVIISSFMMALACIIMANLPTYEQIGITAAWGITVCRIFQGLSCQGEIIGVEIYLTEITKPPARYPIVSLTSFFASLGGLISLGLASLLNVLEISWRLAFWIGAAISSIGFTARAHLRETPEFINMQNALKGPNKKIRRAATKWQGSIKNKTILAYFLISCGYPACFYLAYIHCGNILKNSYAYTAEQIIKHNLILAFVQSLSFFAYALISYRIHPLTILKVRLGLFFPVILFYPFLLDNIQTPLELLMLQSIIMGIGIIDVPAAGIFISHFPILKRFTNTSVIYAFSRMAVYIVTSFGMVYLTDAFNDWGVWLMMILFCLGFSWSIHYFKDLEGVPSSSSPFSKIFFNVNVLIKKIRVVYL
jgi:MHS family proline/betaine transporter-like MFS transporter